MGRDVTAVVAELDDAARAASQNYAAMHDSLAEDEQIRLVYGEDREAARAGYWARIVFEAMDAEVHDPEPGPAPYCGCWSCWSYLRRGR